MARKETALGLRAGSVATAKPLRERMNLRIASVGSRVRACPSDFVKPKEEETLTMMERIEKMRVSDEALDLVFQRARTLRSPNASGIAHPSGILVQGPWLRSCLPGPPCANALYLEHD
jgi:hypothetical protein